MPCVGRRSISKTGALSPTCRFDFLFFRLLVGEADVAGKAQKHGPDRRYRFPLSHCSRSRLKDVIYVGQTFVFAAFLNGRQECLPHLFLVSVGDGREAPHQGVQERLPALSIWLFVSAALLSWGTENEIAVVSLLLLSSSVWVRFVRVPVMVLSFFKRFGCKSFTFELARPKATRRAMKKNVKTFSRQCRNMREINGLRDHNKNIGNKGSRGAIVEWFRWREQRPVHGVINFHRWSLQSRTV